MPPIPRAGLNLEQRAGSSVAGTTRPGCSMPFHQNILSLICNVMDPLTESL